MTKPDALLRNISCASETVTDMDFAMTSARVATNIANNINEIPISERFFALVDIVRLFILP